MGRPISGWRLWRLAWRVTLLNLKAQLEYRVDFLLWTLHGIAYQVMGLTFVWVVLSRFHAMRGWSTADILFMYSLRMLGHSLYLPVFWNIFSIAPAVRAGNFDRILLRPLNPLLQVLLQAFNANVAGDGAVAIVLFAVAQRMLHLHWTAPMVLYLVLVIAGSALLEAAIQLAIATLSFWVVDASPLNWWADELVNTFANYPLGIYGAAVRYLFTFVVPVAFLGYFPAAALLGKVGTAGLTPLFAYGTPAVAVLAFALAYAFWNAGLRRYQSTGT